MGQQNADNKVFSGLLWRFGERVAAEGVSFAVSLVVTRLLLPEYYGVVSIARLFLVIFKAVVQDGFGYALIQKKDADALDFSTVFYLQMVLGFGLYLFVWLLAPTISAWYGEPLLLPVFRVMGLTLPVGAFNCVQQSYVSRGMQFKRFFFSTIIGTLLSAAVGLCMAYAGCGVWALVAQNLTNLICDTLILWFTVRWRPTLQFSFTRLRGMLSFSWKMMVTTMIDNLYNSLYPMALGKLFGTAQQGYYDRGDIIPNTLASNVTMALKSVLLSAFSKEQSDPQQLKQMLKNSIRMAGFVFFPLMAGLITASGPLISVLLTDEWAESAMFLRYCSLFFVFVPIHVIHQQAITALGQSGITLKLEIGKKIIGVTCLIVGVPFGVNGLLIGKAVSSLLGLMLTAIPVRKVFDYGFFEQVSDLFPSAMLSGFMAALAYVLTMLGWGSGATLLLQICCGVIFYLLAAKLCRIKELDLLLDKAKTFLRK